VIFYSLGKDVWLLFLYQDRLNFDLCEKNRRSEGESKIFIDMKIVLVFYLYVVGCSTVTV